MAKFEMLMEEPLDKKIKNAHLAGFFFGYSQCSRMIFMGIIFWIGSVVILNFGYPPEDVYMSINILMSATMGAGVSMANIPSIGRAKASAKKIFTVVDEKSTLDVRDSSKALNKEIMHGEIKFNNVNF